MSRHFDLMQPLQVGQETVSHGRAKHVSTTPKIREDFRSRTPFHDEALNLVQRIFLMQAQKPPHVVVFAGVEHGSGCSQICASVAETLARVVRRPVCLLEGNFRSPALASTSNMTNDYGLADALVSEEAITIFCKPLAQENLWILSAGALDADSPSLLTSENLRDRFTELRNAFEFVVVDAPPIERFAETIILGQLADGLVLVLEAGSTHREPATEAVSSLRSSNIPILAAVLNKHSQPVPKKISKLI
jgi:Mrp family chromosome partitioning ATPase